MIFQVRNPNCRSPASSVPASSLASPSSTRGPSRQGAHRVPCLDEKQKRYAADGHLMTVMPPMIKVMLDAAVDDNAADDDDDDDMAKT